MAKKGVKSANITLNIKTPKQRAPKATSPVIKEKVEKENPIVKLLIENFVGLQKTFIILNDRVEKLTASLADLLRLFELSAKNIAEKPELGFEKEFTEKLNMLIEQNKLLARGITLMSQQAMAPQAMPQPAMPQPTYQPPAQQRPTGPMPEPSEQYAPSGYQSNQPLKPKPLPQA